MKKSKEMPMLKNNKTKEDCIFFCDIINVLKCSLFEINCTHISVYFFIVAEL